MPRGVAWLNRDGEHRLFKRPLPAEQFVEHKAFPQMLAGVDNRTTVLLGHTRWRTRGDEQVNRNNHPIRSGDVIGIHNGTIYNADELFRRYRLSRYAEVDSEILFRIAATALTRRGRIDIRWLTTRLRHCRGQIAAVLASRRAPKSIVVLKGNNPLEFRWNARLHVMMYASSASYLTTVLANERGWRHLPTMPMSCLVFRPENLSSPAAGPLDFVALAARWGDIGGYQQSWFDDL